MLRGGKPRPWVPEAGVLDAEMVLFLQAFERDAWERRIPVLPVEGLLVYDLVGSAAWLGLGCSVVHAERLWNLSSREWELLGLIGQESARRSGARVVWAGPGAPWSWSLRNFRGIEFLDWPLSGGLRKADIFRGSRGCSPARGLVLN